MGSKPSNTYTTHQLSSQINQIMITSALITISSLTCNAKQFSSDRHLLQSIIGPNGQDCTPGSNDAPNACPIDANGTYSSLAGTLIHCEENFDCCTCSSITCGKISSPYCNAFVSDGNSSAFYVYPISIVGDPSSGASIECNGYKSCEGSQINGRFIKEVACRDARSCADTVWNISCLRDQSCTMQCTGFEACAGEFTIFNADGLNCASANACVDSKFKIHSAANITKSMSCAGNNACSQSYIEIDDVDSIRCFGEASCANAVFNVTDPMNGFIVQCKGSRSCEGLTLIIEVSSNSSVTTFEGFDCGSEAACRDANIVITNKSPNDITVNQLNCGASLACANATFFIQEVPGLIIVDDCICGNKDGCLGAEQIGGTPIECIIATTTTTTTTTTIITPSPTLEPTTTSGTLEPTRTREPTSTTRTREPTTITRTHEPTTITRTHEPTTSTRRTHEPTIRTTHTREPTTSTTKHTSTTRHTSTSTTRHTPRPTITTTKIKPPHWHSSSYSYSASYSDSWDSGAYGHHIVRNKDVLSGFNDEVQDTIVVHDAVGAKNAGVTYDGSIMECNEDRACEGAQIEARDIERIHCGGLFSCASAQIRIVDPKDAFAVVCYGKNACEKLVLEVILTSDNTVTRFDGIICVADEACVDAWISIVNLTPNTLLIEELNCEAWRACASASFNFIGSVLFETCKCGDNGCMDTDGIDQCYDNLDILECKQSACFGQSATIVNPSNGFQLVCDAFRSCHNFELTIIINDHARDFPVREIAGVICGHYSACKGLKVNIVNEQTEVILYVNKVQCIGNKSCVKAVFSGNNAGNVLFREIECNENCGASDETQQCKAESNGEHVFCGDSEFR